MNPACSILILLTFTVVSCDRWLEPDSSVKPASSRIQAEDPLPETVTFNEHVQPILSEYCYHCHGPDSGTREPKEEPLRLDLEEKAFAPRQDGSPVIIKGDPEASRLIRLVRSMDPSAVMPPPASHKILKPREIALLEKWIRGGANYQAHWSFIAPVKASLPAVGERWASNPIDRFVAEKLATAKLAPNPAEEPRRFFRRLHLDLTGLPPSPEATEEFFRAASVNYGPAVDQAADRLLASPAAAEHQARIWLDAARYADTHGIHIDNYRAIWPYRDWVIDAFARNLPWDEFTIEQIAGDLLPAPTLEQRIATGFSRCLPTTGEGGAIAEEYEAIYAKDRVDTVSAVWLGLTTGCAACHDHKFDPISTKEFYALTAFFRNTTMGAMDGNNAEHPPNIFAPVPEDRPRWIEIGDEIAKQERSLAARATVAKDDFQRWLPAAKIDPGADLDRSLAIHLPLSENSTSRRGVANGSPFEAEISGPSLDGPLGPALRLDSVDQDLGDFGAFSRADQVSFGGYVYIEGTPRGAIIARMDPARKHRGWDLWLEGDGRIAAHVIDRWPDAANKIASKPLESGKWHHVMVVFDGARASHQTMKLYVNGVSQGALETNTLGAEIVAATPLRLGARAGGVDRVQGVAGLQDFRFYRRALAPNEILTLSKRGHLRAFLAVPDAERTAEQTDALFKHFLGNADPASLEISRQLAMLREDQEKLRAKGSITLVMQEKTGQEAFAHVLERGVYSSKGERVTAGVPAALPSLPEGAPRDRMALAKWLVDPANPLSARVTVNRAWLKFFGTGIVESADDFGIMGTRPSHPELLDWLAVEFTESGWDYRHVLKLIVTSSTYRQSAVSPPEKLEIDPYNRLLARGPRSRLDAEVIRDLALSSAGLLSAKTGGPPAKPYQPDGIWEAVAMPQSNTRKYVEDQGDGLYRRSLYTFWKRTAPPPSMEILNAPSREVTCVRRDYTNTPLQALVLQNDPQFVEACRELAAHAIRQSGDMNSRLDYITLRLLGRPLVPSEREIVGRTLKSAAESFSSNPENAAAITSVGATSADANLPKPELAAWTLVASQILNLDEAVTR